MCQQPRQQAIVGPMQRWVMVGVVGDTLIVGVLTLAQHWTNSKISTVEVLLLAQRWNFNYAPTVDFELQGQCWPKNMHADKSRVISLNFKFILIMQKLYNLLLGENSVILFYNNNFMIYLIIVSDFDNLKLDKILEIFIQSLCVL